MEPHRINLITIELVLTMTLIMDNHGSGPYQGRRSLEDEQLIGSLNDLILRAAERSLIQPINPSQSLPGS